MACGLTLPACEAWRLHDQIRTAMFTPQTGDPARLDVQGLVPILHLYGTPEETGRQYGALMRPALQGLSGYFRCMLWLQRDGILGYARDHEAVLPEEIRRQLHAMAETSGVDYDELVALNVIPRFMCTSLAVWGPATADGHMIMGRNGDDFGMGLDDCCNLLVVYHPDAGRPVVLVTFVGMAGGFMGMNAQGVSFGNMLALNVKGRREEGLPIQLAMRLAAQTSDTAREMVDRLAGMTHVIPNNVMVVDEREALVAELGADRAQVRAGADGMLASANYFLEHPDRLDRGHSDRYDDLVRVARQHPGAMTVETMKTALYAARRWWLNYRAAIFEPGPMRMHVSLNCNEASAGPYVTLDVRQLLAE
jgi:hypothetical protein